MKKTVIILGLIVLLGALFFVRKSSAPPVIVEQISTAPFDQLTVEAGSLIESPFLLEGRAPGPWYFEASFPVKLFDSTGKELLRVPAQAQGEWMTEDRVPFSVTLIFPQPETATGTLRLQKDNPSGLPEHDAALTIPVRFRE